MDKRQDLDVAPVEPDGEPLSVALVGAWSLPKVALYECAAPRAPDVPVRRITGVAVPEPEVG